MRILDKIDQKVALTCYLLKSVLPSENSGFKGRTDEKVAGSSKYKFLYRIRIKCVSYTYRVLGGCYRYLLPFKFSRLTRFTPLQAGPHNGI